MFMQQINHYFEKEIMMKKLLTAFLLFILAFSTLHAFTVVEDALLNTKNYTVTGTFSQHDFADADTPFDWVFTTEDGQSYQLQGNAPTQDNLFGFKSVTIETPAAQWYMVQLNSDVDGDGSRKFDWVLLSADPSNLSAFKLTGVAPNGTFEYSDPLDVNYTIFGVNIYISTSGTVPSIEIGEDGEWILTITGTATAMGQSTDIPEVIINLEADQVATSANRTAAEEFISQNLADNGVTGAFTMTLVSETEDKIVWNVHYDLTAQNFTIVSDMVYTYEKQ